MKKNLVILIIILCCIKIFSENEKLYDLKNFVISEIKENRKLWDLNAKSAVVLKNENTLVKNFYLKLYKNGVEDATVTGDSGTVFQNRNIEITNNVKIKNCQNIEIITDYLFWDNKNLYFYNNSDVVITKNNLELKCTGIEYYEMNSLIKLKKNFYLRNKSVNDQYIKSDKAAYFVDKLFIKLNENILFKYGLYELTNDYSEIFLDKNNNLKNMNGYINNKVTYLNNSITSDSLYVVFVDKNIVKNFSFENNINIKYLDFLGKSNNLKIELSNKKIKNIAISNSFNFKNDTYIVNGTNLISEFKNDFPLYASGKKITVLFNNLINKYYMTNTGNSYKLNFTYNKNKLKELVTNNRTKLYTLLSEEITGDYFDIIFNSDKSINKAIIKNNIVANKNNYDLNCNLITLNNEKIFFSDSIKFIDNNGASIIHSDTGILNYTADKKIDRLTLYNLNNSVVYLKK